MYACDVCLRAHGIQIQIYWFFLILCFVAVTAGVSKQGKINYPITIFFLSISVVLRNEKSMKE